MGTRAHFRPVALLSHWPAISICGVFSIFISNKRCHRPSVYVQASGSVEAMWVLCWPCSHYALHLCVFCLFTLVNVANFLAVCFGDAMRESNVMRDFFSVSCFVTCVCVCCYCFACNLRHCRHNTTQFNRMPCHCHIEHCLNTPIRIHTNMLATMHISSALCTVRRCCCDTFLLKYINNTCENSCTGCYLMLNIRWLSRYLFRMDSLPTNRPPTDMSLT